MTTRTEPDSLSQDLAYLKLPVIRQQHRSQAELARQQGQSHLEFLSALVDQEVSGRRERATKARLAAARMPCVKTLDGWDWKWNSASIRRDEILALLQMKFLDDNANVLLLGKSGLGKTRIALALAHQACVRGVRTLFTTAADMINRLQAATADHSLEKALLSFTKPRLVVIDEVGYLPFDKLAGDLFFQVIAKRYEQGSTILTCNRAFGDWSEIFADPIVASVIIERLVHHAQIFSFKGKSYRLKDRLELAEKTTSTS
jgi:DNA replication protein DnaC